MSQQYLMRYPLIHGQGALGTQEDNSMVASSRYTEAKPSIYADLMMIDFKKNAVPLKETYNGEFMEPVVLPALFPNALCNGRQAVGISMAHSSLPHNLTEVCNAIIAYIKDNNLTDTQVLEYIPGPDFPLGGTIINKKDIKVAFATGKSTVSLKVRGDYEINGDVITFNTIPYRTYRNKIKEQLEKNVETLEKYMEDFDDESNLGVNKLIFTAKKGQVNALLNQLFALTDLQAAVSYNMNFIVDGTPKLCSMLDLIKAYVKHQNNVMVNVANTDLTKSKEKEHIYEGLLIAIKDIDTAIQIIKSSEDKAEANKKLVAHFGITQKQADAILDMKLSRLTKLDKDDLLKQLEELRLTIAKLIKIVNDQEYRNEELIKKVKWLRNTYGDERRTKLIDLDVKKETPVKEERPPEPCVVILTANASAKKIMSKSFKPQRRNGKGVKTQEDITQDIIHTDTNGHILVFTSIGRMYSIPVDQIPEGTNISKGMYLGNLIQLAAGETITLIASDEAIKDEKNNLIFATKYGIIKKTKMSEYNSASRKQGVAAIKLRDDDSIAAMACVQDEEVIFITKHGMMERITTTDIGASGRNAIGVKGMGLADDDEVIAIVPVDKLNKYLCLFTEDGMGKKLPLSEVPVQKRGGKGQKYYKDKIVVDGMICNDDDSVLVVGATTSICVNISDIPETGRTTVGVKIIQNRIRAVSKV